MELASSQDEVRSPAMEQLYEPVVVPDTFVTGMVGPEAVEEEGTLRLTFFVKRRSTYGSDEHTIEARLILSPRTAWQIAKAIFAHFGCAAIFKHAGRMN